jgi:hypothetical protein
MELAGGSQPAAEIPRPVAPVAFSAQEIISQPVEAPYRSAERSSDGFSDGNSLQLAAAYAPSPLDRVQRAPARSALLFSPEATTRSRLSARRASPGTLSPWIDAVELGRPEGSPEEIFEVAPVELSPCALFEEELDKRNSLSRAPVYAHADPWPLFYIAPPVESQFARKMGKILQEKMYREFRKHLKRQWKSLYRDHPSMPVAFYEDRLLQINNIGKDPQEYDEFNIEYRTNEAKQNVFHRRKLEGEPDVGLFTWGPLTVTDSGALKFDLGTAAHAGEVDEEIKVGEEKPKPFLSTKDYRIETSFNIDVDPFKGYRQGEVLDVLRRYGVTVGINWLSDVLGREMVTTELELEANMRGEFGVFANIVIKSR